MTLKTLPLKRRFKLRITTLTCLPGAKDARAFEGSSSGPKLMASRPVGVLGVTSVVCTLAPPPPPQAASTSVTIRSRIIFMRSSW